MSTTMLPGPSIIDPWTPKQKADARAAEDAILGTADFFRQPLASIPAQLAFGQPYTVNVPLQNVGLLTKVIIEVAVVVTNPGGGSLLTRTPWNAANVLSTISYTDPNTYNRINCPGWGLMSVTSRRKRRPPGAAYTTDSPMDFGSVVQPMACPATIAAGASGTVRVIYEVPISLGRHNLKGAVWQGSNFVTQSLQLTLNPNLAQVGTDGLGAVFTGASGANPPTYAVTISGWQEYYFGFDLNLLGPLTPFTSMIYELKNTTFPNIVANQDNYIPFSQLRTFLSATLAYDNGGTYNAGTDIGYFARITANQTTAFKQDAYLQSYLTRDTFGGDWPVGNYVFSFDPPILTAAQGNTVLSINPTSANAGAQVQVMWEDLAIGSVLAGAPALSGSAGAG